MKQLLLTTILICQGLNGMAQDTTISGHTHIVMSNGATVTSTFNRQSNTLNVEVQNNNDDLEVIVVDNGVVIDRETTIFEDDNMKMELPASPRTIDIYARTRNEVQYMGSVKTENK